MRCVMIKKRVQKKHDSLSGDETFTLDDKKEKTAYSASLDHRLIFFVSNGTKCKLHIQRKKLYE